MWNWMSAAGRPPRVRVKATTSATVELSLPERRSSHSASGLRLVGAVQRVLVGDLPDHRHERVVLEVAPDAGQLVARPRTPAARSSSAGPDARQQQQLRRADRAGATAAPRARPARPPRRRGRWRSAHADRAVALELDAQHGRRPCAPRGSGASSAGRR